MHGWKSTKLHLACITMALLTLVYGLAGCPDALFGEYAMAVITAAGIYSGSSAFEKTTLAKHSKPKVDAPE